MELANKELALNKELNAIASRLEGICEPNKIKISHPTWALISDEIDCTPGEKVKVKGINREIMTYDVLMS